jgi:AmiR/NasT family two-component response regulator
MNKQTKHVSIGDDAHNKLREAAFRERKTLREIAERAIANELGPKQRRPKEPGR